MNWKGQELLTIGDLCRLGIDKCNSPEEAQEFMRLYRIENEYADQNIGYLSGYYGRDDMRRIQEWFGVSHPIFGTSVPSPEDAFAAGEQMAKEADMTSERKGC